MPDWRGAFAEFSSEFYDVNAAPPITYKNLGGSLGADYYQAIDMSIRSAENGLPGSWQRPICLDIVSTDPSYFEKMKKVCRPDGDD